MRRFLRDNGLSLFFGLIFLLALTGQAWAGRLELNASRQVDGLPPLGVARYLTSADFAVDVMENWQSEYLQFLLFVFATVWLLQRGSPESKELGKSGEESDEDQLVGEYAKPEAPAWARAGGLRTALYSRSLGLAMGAIFLGSWFAQSVAGRSAHNEERLEALQAPVSWGTYVTSAEFWSRTLQNWQSEFLAVGSMAVLSIYLRERGSPESKPVGAAHEATGVEG